MKKTLYLECYSGISGDMTVAALLDLGADQQVLSAVLSSLNLAGYKIKIGRVKKNGIDACDFNVILEGHDHKPHEHTHHEHKHDEHHDHEHTHHDHDHNEHHEHMHHEQEHRNIHDILKIIDDSSLTETAKQLSRKIFAIIARAEAKAHGIPEDQVHFHEVGAIDSIVDIISTAVCLDNLEVENTIVSQLYEGQGFVHCQHGLMPVPVPAVVNIISENHLPIRVTHQRGEMVTPTGAAIAAALRTEEHLPESFVIDKVGLGAGKKDFSTSNVLRAFLITI